MGGAWCNDGPQNAFVELKEGANTQGLCKASSMLEFLAWNPSTVKRSAFSVLSVPIQTDFGGKHSGYRGNVYMMNLIGQCLAASDCSVKALIFDAHGSHNFIRRYIHGQPIPSLGPNHEDVEGIPFFNKLKFQELPDHSPIPKLPVKIAFHEDEPFYVFPGVCSSAFLWNGWAVEVKADQEVA